MKLNEELVDLGPQAYHSYRKPNRKNLRVKANFYFSDRPKSQKVQFLAFKTLELAKEYMDRNYPYASGSHQVDGAVGYFQPVRKLDDNYLIGVIVTGGEWVKDVIINHECCHAVFHWFVRNGMGSKIDEEEFCIKLGSISASILRICLEAYHVDEVLPASKNSKPPIRDSASNAKSRKR